MALASCIITPSLSPGIGSTVPWTEVSGWTQDSVAQAWPALINSCQIMPLRDARWREPCLEAGLFQNPNDETARAFFETRFEAHEVIGTDRSSDGLITGYYEPLLFGSFNRTERYRFPVFGRPDDLVVVDLGELYPELKGKRYRGRITNHRLVPYYSRAEIANGKQPPNDTVLLWVDDPVALFFLEIQGSGRIQLPDGRILPIGYADQNGHPYVSIGRTLVEAGVMTLDEATMPTIYAWLKANPEQARKVMNTNPSYVFFRMRDPDSFAGPVGALNVPLIPERSVAVDPSVIPLGSPVWIDTTLPNVAENHPYRRLVFAQDTGGAIRGPVRADVFFGFGPSAEQLAGSMRQRGKMYVLQPLVRTSKN